MGGENWGDSSRESSRGPRVHDRRSSASVMVAREYSMAGLQHVRQQLLDERAAIDLALAEAGDASTQQVGIFRTLPPAPLPHPSRR